MHTNMLAGVFESLDLHGDVYTKGIMYLDKSDLFLQTQDHPISTTIVIISI